MDLLITNVHLATMAGGYGEVRHGAIAVKDGRIAWLGPRDGAPAAAQVFDGSGAWLTPGLIDCHTHIVHAGNRSDEFEARLNGATYEDIARSGGGIMSTVRATRAASDDELLQQSLPRIRSLMAEGVTTIEIKSGYGLSLESERAMLRVARRVGQELPVNVATTFLGAHAVPPEFARCPDDYIDNVCGMMPVLVAEGLVDAVDAFCERIGFTLEQTERVFAVAQALDLPVKLHAEQLSDQRGAELVARFRGLSADHLEHLSQAGVDAMAALRQAKVPMAVATDCNPGTSPMTSLLLAMNMACTLWRLTPLEALAGTTVHAARALGRERDIGTLEVGKRADFALWGIARPADLSYAMGLNPCRAVFHAGVARA